MDIAAMRRRGIRRDGHHPPRDTLRTQTMAIAQTAAMAISQGAPQQVLPRAPNAGGVTTFAPAR
jgi:hypothetical protein